MQHKLNLYGQTQDELKQFLVTKSFSRDLASIIFQKLYKRKKIQKSISVNLNQELQKHFSLTLPQVLEQHESSDGTIKFLMQFSDQLSVETVLVPFHHKFTVCLSTQVGCAMKCSFCYTGTMGLKRHLNAAEIIGQYLVAWNVLREKYPEHTFTPNIVFMGQGEPLHNADQVMKAITIMMEPAGLGIGPRQMTLSTAGHLPGLKKFKNFPQVNLALSLHSPFNEIRRTLIPINEQWPLEDIFEELKEIEIGLRKNQYITYEYLLIKGVNDRLEDAEKLQERLSGRKAIINIIPFNPFPGSHFQRPSILEVDAFKELLVARKLRVLVRTTKGSDILAACGQLVSNR